MLQRIRLPQQIKIITRGYATNDYRAQLQNARINIKKSLEQFDRSSLILSAYVPEPARDAFLAIRALNVEISKINAKNNQINIGGISSLDLKFKFWTDFLGRVYQNPHSNSKINEPSMFLIRDSLRNGIELNLDFFSTFIETKKNWLTRPQTYLQSADSICSYGEGTFSQLLYLQQNAMLSKTIAPSVVHLLQESEKLQSLCTDVVAHLGQANAIASFLLSLKYYAKQELIPLPIDLMAQHDLSQNSLIEYLKGESARDIDLEEKLKNVVFETSTRANDHLLTSRYKLEEIKQEISQILTSTKDELVLKRSKQWKKGVPDVLFVPFLNSVPLDIFVSDLEKRDFNILDKRLTNSNWNRYKVVGKSWWRYNQRKI